METKHNHITATRKRMHAVICTAYGSADVLKYREVDVPVPAENEVLIRVYAAVTTTASLAGRTGKPAFARLFSGLMKPKQPILGQELAGEIVAVGSAVEKFKVGERVFGLSVFGYGAHAEYKTMAEDDVLAPLPVGASFEEAVAVIEGGLTAINFLKHQAFIQPGQKVLIYGASGSVGTAAVQVAKHFGAEVTGVCSGVNAALVKSLGADKVIDYTLEDFTANGETYDIIFDTLGKRSFRECKASLTPNGIYLDSGSLDTLWPMLWTSVFGRQKAILSATYVRSNERNLADLMTLKRLVEAGAFRAVIDRRYPLEKTAEAYRYIETGRKKGNVVLQIGTVEGDETEAVAMDSAVFDPFLN